MKCIISKYLSILTTYITLCLFCLPPGHGQPILNYGPDALTAAVHYNGFLYGIYEKVYSKQPEYPIKGAYSPSHYTNASKGIPPGAGACNYIYIPTKGVLIPGHQYKISLAVILSEAYTQVPYFRSHFGVALATDLFENYFGLWSKHHVPLGIETTKELVWIDFVFRPLCTSNYVVLGVFQGPTMDKQDCFACQYGFELHNLMIEVWNEPKADFVYMCDAFEEERLKRRFSNAHETDTVYFASGSANVQEKYLSVLDSIPSKLRTKQDLITLYAYTDIAGSENESLGAARNAAVREALIVRGVDSTRILMVNYGESKASNRISQEDRRVEIDINRGKLYQKYYTEALQAATRGEYNIAQSKLTNWMKMVPPENAIYALFECWGEGEKATFFRHNLLKNIRSKYYSRGKDLKFIVDSLYCEDQKGRALSMYLRNNYLPDFNGNCNYGIDSLRDVSHQSIIDRVYTEYGFPTVADVGERGNKVLPYMILHTRDTSFQKRYLPIVRKACEEQLLNWEYYAMLYDKISVFQNGHQRYGTQRIVDKNGVLGGLCPYEDVEMVAEYRMQVGLAPMSDY